MVVGLYRRVHAADLLAKEDNMIGINLHGESLTRYRKIRKEKMLFGMPDSRGLSWKPRIRECHLTPRQKKKFAEMTLEGCD
jgi:hypothetical protein